MMYDLIEVTPKKNWKKIVIVGAIVLVVILLVALVIIKNIGGFNKSSTEKFTNDVNSSEASNIVAEIETKKTKHVAKIDMTPTYTDKRKKLI